MTREHSKALGAVVVMIAGTILLIENMTIGGYWRAVLGVTFTLFGLYRGWQILKEKRP